MRIAHLTDLHPPLRGGSKTHLRRLARAVPLFPLASTLARILDLCGRLIHESDRPSPRPDAGQGGTHGVG